MQLMLTQDLKKVFDKAVNLAISRKDEYITPEHILFALCENESFSNVFEILGGDIDELQTNILKELDEDLDKITNGKIKESKGFTDLCMIASINGLLINKPVISIQEIISAFGKLKCSGTELIEDQGIQISTLIKEFKNEYKINSSEKVEDLLNDKDSIESDSEELFSKKASWKKYLTCLNDVSLKNTIPFIGRTVEINRISEVLCRATKNNPILVGEPGVGKTAIIEGLVKAINDGIILGNLKNAEIYSLDLAGLVSGASFRGEFEDRLTSILEGLSKNVENPILYIDEIHNLVNIGGQGVGIDGANLIKKYAQDGKIKFIGTTTYDEYKKIFQKDKSLDRRFKKIDILEPSVSDTIEILNGIKNFYENFHKVKYSKEAIEQAVILSDKYINNKFLPDKAIDLIDEAGACFSMKRELTGSRNMKITKDIIEEVLAKTCNIPKQTLESSDIDKLMHLEENIKNEVFGQDEAAKQIVNSIKLSRAGLNDGNKPIASLLFVGPTGVGKTEIAKCVAKQMFGSEDKLIRFDMSEYMEKHTVSKLIGSPAGYVGYEDGGLLVDKIIQNPSCVLLFDEIEKAHPDVFNALLQVMDYATLTDNKGRKADFRNVLIIMTSNAGATSSMAPSLGFNVNNNIKVVDNSKILDAVKNLFAPEFRNRLTKTIIFNPMDDDMATKIVDKQLNIFSSLLANKKVKVSFDKEVKNYIKKKGVSEKFGAREIQRVIENEIKPLFIDEILNGKLTNGGNCKVIYNETSGFVLQISERKTKNN